jgi:hypothetical protein
VYHSSSNIRFVCRVSSIYVSLKLRIPVRLRKKTRQIRITTTMITVAMGSGTLNAVVRARVAQIKTQITRTVRRIVRIGI